MQAFCNEPKEIVPWVNEDLPRIICTNVSVSRRRWNVSICIDASSQSSDAQRPFFPTCAYVCVYVLVCVCDEVWFNRRALYLPHVKSVVMLVSTRESQREGEIAKERKRGRERAPRRESKRDRRRQSRERPASTFPCG